MGFRKQVTSMKKYTSRDQVVTHVIAQAIFNARLARGDYDKEIIEEMKKNMEEESNEKDS